MKIPVLSEIKLRFCFHFCFKVRSYGTVLENVKLDGGEVVSLSDHMWPRAELSIKRKLKSVR